MTRLLKIATCLACVLALGACETMEGAAQDLNNGANTVRGWFN